MDLLKERFYLLLKANLLDISKNLINKETFSPLIPT